jgi:hypothetical protein
MRHAALPRWALPTVACLFLFAFYWRGLDCWFYQDDFGWLHLGPARGFGDFLHILFAPKAHGNLRPWSENLFFYGLKALFGVNPLPFRIVVFATMAASLFLLDAIVRRLTSSPAAAFAAQLCWLANPAVSAVLCWTCIYNQAQYVFFLLLALFLLLEGRWVAQAAVFTVGLGSLELMVMYPAIASLWALLYRREALKRTLPLFGVSAAYTALHFALAPAPRSGPYALQWSPRIFETLANYTRMALGPERLMHFLWNWPQWLLPAGTALMALLAIVALCVGRRAALLGAGIYLLLLAPVLPLPDHIMDYLLYGPALGLAVVLASGLAGPWRKAAAAICICYLAVCLPASWMVMTWNYERSHVSRDLVLSVVQYQRAHPDKTLLLTGMDTGQFLAGFADLSFELYGMMHVRLAPGAEANIHDPARIAPLYVLKPEKSLPMLQAGQAVVLDVAGGKVREVTAEYLAAWRSSK